MGTNFRGFAIFFLRNSGKVLPQKMLFASIREKLEIGQFAKLNPREKSQIFFFEKIFVTLSPKPLKEQASFR